jgi:hypothetical protein
MFQADQVSFQELSVANINKLVDSEQIFEYYIGSSFKQSKRISSPLRKDNTPSFSVFKNPYGKYLFKDFATGQSGDWVTFIRLKYNCTFPEALQIVNNDFNLKLGQFQKTIKVGSTAIISQFNITKPKETVIRISKRDWNQLDLNYWNSFGVSIETLNKFNVVPVDKYWLEGHEFNCKEITYAYMFGDFKYKIYAPLAEKAGYKFIFNGSDQIIQGIKELPEYCSWLVITKSMKDVLLFHDLGVPAISPHSETVVLSENIMNYLYSISGRIFSLFDYDNAGIHLAWQYRKLYGIKPLFLSEGTWKRKLGYKSAKDISDYYKLYGKEATKDLITERAYKENIRITF